jgi:hypothetical protein
MDVIPQLLKALAPILIKFLGKMTEVKPLQPENILYIDNQ